MCSGSPLVSQGLGLLKNAGNVQYTRIISQLLPLEFCSKRAAAGQGLITVWLSDKQTFAQLRIGLTLQTARFWAENAGNVQRIKGLGLLKKKFKKKKKREKRFSAFCQTYDIGCFSVNHMI